MEYLFGSVLIALLDFTGELIICFGDGSCRRDSPIKHALSVDYVAGVVVTEDFVRLFYKLETQLAVQLLLNPLDMLIKKFGGLL